MVWGGEMHSAPEKEPQMAMNLSVTKTTFDSLSADFKAKFPGTCALSGAKILVGSACRQLTRNDSTRIVLTSSMARMNLASINGIWTTDYTLDTTKIPELMANPRVIEIRVLRNGSSTPTIYFRSETGWATFSNMTRRDISAAQMVAQTAQTLAVAGYIEETREEFRARMAAKRAAEEAAEAA